MYKNTKNRDEKIELNKRGIDAYHCYFDSVHGLDVRMVWGFMNGENFQFSILNDSLKTSHRSWGDTRYEWFKYKTLDQALKLETFDFENTDSLIGYIYYLGIQNIDKKIREWSDCGADTEWLYHLTPDTAKIEGYFKLKLFDDIKDQYITEYNRMHFNKKR